MRLAAACLAAACLAAACGLVPLAQDNAIIPALVQSWPPIRSEILITADPGEIAKAELFGSAIESRSVAQIVGVGYLWPELKDLAEAGIEVQVSQGVIGPGVSASLLERLESFEDALIALGISVIGSS